MILYTNFEKDIQKAISNKLENIYPSRDMFSEVIKKLDYEKEREHIMNTNKLRSPKRILIVSIILILTVTTSFAAVKIGNMNSNNTTYTEEFPTAKEVKNAAGFAPKFVEEFSNGATFQRSSAGQMAGGEGRDIFTAEMLDMVYTKGDMKIFVSATNKAGLILYTKEEMKAFIALDDKFAAEEIDLTNHIKGVYLIDGSISESHGALYWEEDEITYNISCLNHQGACLTIDEMIDMANKVILKK